VRHIAAWAIAALCGAAQDRPQELVLLEERGRRDYNSCADLAYVDDHRRKAEFTLAEELKTRNIFLEHTRKELPGMPMCGAGHSAVWHPLAPLYPKQRLVSSPEMDINYDDTYP
jgi:hypothetical protein